MFEAEDWMYNPEIEEPNLLTVTLDPGAGNIVKVVFDYDDNIVKVVRKLPYSRFNGEYWVTFRRHLVYLMALLEESDHEVCIHPELQDFYASELARIDALGKPPELPATPLELELKIDPAPFQNVGARFLMLGNKILADETGAGKTLQAMIGALAEKKAGTVRRILIVAPAKVKKEWVNQIEEFTGASVINVRGTPKQRMKLLGLAPNADFTIVNYDLIKVREGNNFEGIVSKRKIEIPSQELEILMGIGYDLVIFDEVTYAMNAMAQRSKGSNRLARKAKFAWGLTGTPLMNNLKELYNVVKLLDPHFFNMTWPEFERHYTNAITGEPIKSKMSELHKKLAPIMLRRLKKDTDPELPELVEMNRYADLAEHQARVYAEAEKELVVYLGQKIKDGTAAHLVIRGTLSRLTRLKQICAHPILVGETKQAVASGKLDLLKNILSEEIDLHNDKVIVFTQFEQLIETLENSIHQFGTTKITGKMSERQTDEAKERFKNDPDCRIMFITTAGGMGLNLQSANYVILYDQLYNPQMMKQITDRAHRRGQKKTVTAIWLWTENTVEEKIWSILKKKKGLFDAVIEGIQEEELSKKLTIDDMKEIMK